MMIAVASDHAGYKIKEKLVELLSKEYKVINFGAFSEESCDYPDYAKKVAVAVQRKEAQRGIILCGSGEGVCIVANKFKGIYAGLCYSDETAKLLTEHNFANIICFPTRVRLCGKEIDVETIYRWAKIWLSSENSKDKNY